MSIKMLTRENYWKMFLVGEGLFRRDDPDENKRIWEEVRAQRLNSKRLTVGHLVVAEGAKFDPEQLKLVYGEDLREYLRAVPMFEKSSNGERVLFAEWRKLAKEMMRRRMLSRNIVNELFEGINACDEYRALNEFLMGYDPLKEE